MKQHLWLIAIVFLALILRITSLENFPAGFTADEAAQGYTAYSILKTGSDEWGVKFPLNPRSFGDFKAPLYTYLVVPSVAVFGLNEFAVRLPNAILGSLAVLVVYFLVREFGFSRIDKRLPAKSAGINADLLPLFSSFLLAISPWHISLSRGAFEANLTTFFLPLAVLSFHFGFKNPLFIILSSIFFSLNLFTYHSAKLVTPLILLTLVLMNKNYFSRKIVAKEFFKYVISVVIFGFFLVLLLKGMSDGGGTRVSDIGIFSGGWQTVAEQRYFAVVRGLPDALSRVFNNKLSFVLNEFIKNYLSYLSPQFLFTQGAGEATYGMIPGRGVLYLFELPFIIASIYLLLKERNKVLTFLTTWILLAPIPASLARGVGYHANRVAVMMPAIQIISAYGAVKIIGWLKERFKQGYKIVISLYCYLVILSFFFFLEDYFVQGPKINAPKMSYGWHETMDYLKTKNAKIIVSRNFSEPQAFVLFYGKIAPSLVQTGIQPWLEYEREGHCFVDQLGTYSLDDYQFRNLAFPEDWQRGKTVLVGTAEDFLIQEKEIQTKKAKGEIKEEKIVEFPDGKIAVRIFSL